MKITELGRRPSTPPVIAPVAFDAAAWQRAFSFLIGVQVSYNPNTSDARIIGMYYRVSVEVNLNSFHKTGRWSVRKGVGSNSGNFPTGIGPDEAARIVRAATEQMNAKNV